MRSLRRGRAWAVCLLADASSHPETELRQQESNFDCQLAVMLLITKCLCLQKGSRTLLCWYWADVFVVSQLLFSPLCLHGTLGDISRLAAKQGSLPVQSCLRSQRVSVTADLLSGAAQSPFMTDREKQAPPGFSLPSGCQVGWTALWGCPGLCWLQREPGQLTSTMTMSSEVNSTLVYCKLYDGIVVCTWTIYALGNQKCSCPPRVRRLTLLLVWDKYFFLFSICSYYCTWALEH